MENMVISVNQLNLGIQIDMNSYLDVTTIGLHHLTSTHLLVRMAQLYYHLKVVSLVRVHHLIQLMLIGCRHLMKRLWSRGSMVTMTTLQLINGQTIVGQLTARLVLSLHRFTVYYNQLLLSCAKYMYISVKT